MAIRMSGLASNMDTESIVTQLMSAQRLKSTKIENKITKLEWKQDIWKGLNTKIYSFYTGSLSKVKSQGAFSTRAATSSNEDRATVAANSGAPTGTHKLRIEQLAGAQFETSGQMGLDTNSKTVTGSTKLADLGMTADGTGVITVEAGTTTKTLTVSSTTTVTDFLSTLKNAGLNASYDTTQKRFFISSKESGNANAFSISGNSAVDLTKLKLATITRTTNADGSYTVSGGANLIAPTDAKFEYNGVEMTSTTNSVTVNGLALTLKSVTNGTDKLHDTADDEEISINVTNDSQAVYDTVKAFVKSYNELLEELNTVYYADTAKGYDPLTSEQKSAMTDDQVTKWETKIKDSLLRRDSSVETVLSTLSSAFTSGVKVGDKTYSLSSFGIHTTDYTEKGKLHIDGDEDDTSVLGKDDKLLAAINDNPEAVMEVFNTLSTKLYDTLTEKMKSTTLNSALTLYNDKDMKKTITNYETELDELNDRLDDMETRYYNQFTAMEKAMASLNSQSSSLNSLLGTSSS